MSAAGTPGPWVASVEPKTFATGGYWYVVTDSEENGIGEFYGEDHEANVANLRLATAAPELYDAVYAFVDRINGGSRADTDYVIGLMNAALAKARGEQVQA